MNPAIALPDGIESASANLARPNFHERLLLRSFSAFEEGALRLVYPDGSIRRLGNASSEFMAEIRFRNPDAFFRRCVLFGNVGFGESYVDGDWDTPDIAAVVSWFITNIVKTQGAEASSSRVAFSNILRGWNRVLHQLRPNSVHTSRRNIAEHYDLGNEFYSLWLDRTMTYSSALFERPNQNLAEAQHAKYESLCQKLQLQPTDHVLEIGCGWGGFCTHAAREYGCKVTAVTISKEQYRYATERVRRERLDHLIEIRLQDYRHIEGQFDKIASIEMLEAVGNQFLETYFAKCAEVLKPDGLLAFQVITVPDSRFKNLRKGVDWIQKHIFPGSLLLSMARVNEAINKTGDFFLHGLHDFGSSYAKTLAVWHDLFNERWSDVSALGFDETFRRKWNYYLKYCEAAFATRNISVIQAVYTRPNNPILNRIG